jgi:hypothetical protein
MSDDARWPSPRQIFWIALLIVLFAVISGQFGITALWVVPTALAVAFGIEAFRAGASAGRASGTRTADPDRLGLHPRRRQAIGHKLTIAARSRRAWRST